MNARDLLSTKSRSRRFLGCLILLTLTIGLVTAGYFRYWKQNLRNFQVLRPGVLFRAGQPSERGLCYLAETHGVKTVVSLRSNEPRLRQGLFFELGEPDGPTESEVAARLGLDYCHWPLGQQCYWPWPTPRHLERFYQLFDDPNRWPVVVHCSQGKHRAGTFAALFRLEYDGWDIEQTLDELNSFDFGPSQPVHEHNLRTYLPRPRPNAQQFAALIDAFSVVTNTQPLDFDDLVRWLKSHRFHPKVAEVLESYVRRDGPFALCLSARLLGTRRNDPLEEVVSERADACLQRADALSADWAISAALIADFGTSEQQESLLDRLCDESRKEDRPSPWYRAVVNGVTNRYTENRIAYLQPLLEDNRQRPESSATKYRYRDTAVARMTSILNHPFNIETARKWFIEHQGGN